MGFRFTGADIAVTTAATTAATTLLFLSHNTYDYSGHCNKNNRTDYYAAEMEF